MLDDKTGNSVGMASTVEPGAGSVFVCDTSDGTWDSE